MVEWVGLVASGLQSCTRLAAGLIKRLQEKLAIFVVAKDLAAHPVSVVTMATAQATATRLGIRLTADLPTCSSPADRDVRISFRTVH